MSTTTTELDVTLDTVAALDMFQGTFGSDTDVIESVEQSALDRCTVIVTLSGGDKYELRVREVIQVKPNPFIEGEIIRDLDTQRREREEA